MGGNHAYSQEMKKLIKSDFFDTAYRLGGHKVLVQKESPNRSKIPMNSKSESPIYLCGKLSDANGGVLSVERIAIYENHKLVRTIDLEFGSNGDYIPFKENGKKVSHAHDWFEKDDGSIWRNAHDKSNVYPVDDKFLPLIEQIVQFNKSKRIWIVTTEK